MSGEAAIKTDPKWIRSEADERAVASGHWFDENAAKHVCKFFEDFLHLTMGQPKPFALLDWQRFDILYPLFGWKRENGDRRYSKGDIFVAKKNGKSTIAAGICLYMLMGNGHRAECYGVAHTREQSAIIYREAAAMATNSPKLKGVIETRDSQKRLIHPKTNSFYAALAGEANARGVEGINPVLVLFDEIHVQRSRELYDALTYASVAQRNSLMLSVSTVGVADQTTIWWEQYEYAKGIIDGTIHDDSRFAYIAQADEGCLESAEMRADPKQWAKANPSLGVTVRLEKIEESVREAEASPAKLNNLLRYVFNIPTAQVNRVVPIENWKAAGGHECSTSRRCFGGLDMASSEDLTAFVLYFPATDTETAMVKSWFWCPEDKVRQREQRQMAFYRQWVNNGDLLQTSGNRIEHDAIAQHIRECFDEYQLDCVWYDPWNADAVVNPLHAEGYRVESLSQTIQNLSAGTTALLDDIAANRIAHDGNQVMTWCLSNCAADTKDDAIKFSKDKSADKIDGAVALAMARGCALAKGHEDETEVGLFFL